MHDMTKLPPALKALMIITARSNKGRLEDFLHDKQIAFHYMINAMGKAKNDMLGSLGLRESEKTICVCIIRSEEAGRLVTSVTDYFSMAKPGNGVVYTLPVSGISAVISTLLRSEKDERSENFMKDDAKKTETAYTLVLSVINQGYSETLMDAAHKVGIPSGTIINARHSAIEDTVKFFGVSLQAEKEIVAIIVPTEKKTELMRVISHKCGVSSDAHGIIISLPVDDCAGLS